MSQKLYRYKIGFFVTSSGVGSYDGDEYYVSRPKLELIEYDVLRETPQGYWFGYGSTSGLHSPKRWTSKTAVRRHAHTTKEDALASFVKRSRYRIGHLKRQMNECQEMMDLAKEMLENKSVS